MRAVIFFALIVGVLLSLAYAEEQQDQQDQLVRAKRQYFGGGFGGGYGGYYGGYRGGYRGGFGRYPGYSGYPGYGGYGGYGRYPGYGGFGPGFGFYG
ncbi:dormancy-associated protein 2 [Drosophila innubila]|uniref:dormancy-associated protein 2 n=1 Tax=Drosophila innubila TaxID=198719 RepID=UPI00148B4402|nr:dormancy-associated protein 2 [Drosophila innubila]